MAQTWRVHVILRQDGKGVLSSLLGDESILLFILVALKQKITKLLTAEQVLRVLLLCSSKYPCLNQQLQCTHHLNMLVIASRLSCLLCYQRKR